MHAEQNVSVATAAPSVNETNDQRKSATQNVLLLGRLAAAIHGPGVPPPPRGVPPLPQMVMSLRCCTVKILVLAMLCTHTCTVTHRRTTGQIRL